MAVLVAVSTLGGSSAPVAAQGGAAVSMVDNAYQPSAVSVPVGARVTWTNSGAAVHTATAQSGAFDSGILNPGQSFSFTASAPGAIPFFCRVHPDVMLGTITVAAAAPAAAPP
ncbi:MAG: cupredoxin domain-containing protein, partial [Dehalococcoidia bacterium]